MDEIRVVGVFCILRSVLDRLGAGERCGAGAVRRDRQPGDDELNLLYPLKRSLFVRLAQ